MSLGEVATAVQLSCGRGVKKTHCFCCEYEKTDHISLVFWCILPAVSPICRAVLQILCGLQKEGYLLFSGRFFFPNVPPILPLHSDQMFEIQPDCYQVSDMLFSHGTKLSVEEGRRADLSMRVDQRCTSDRAFTALSPEGNPG